MENEVTLTAEEIAQHVSAMGDSVTVINEEILKPYTEQVVRRIKANTSHLALMLEKDFIIADSGGKDAFTTAIADGEAFIALGAPSTTIQSTK